MLSRVASVFVDAAHRMCKLGGWSHMRSLLEAIGARRPDVDNATMRKAAFPHIIEAVTGNGST